MNKTSLLTLIGLLAACSAFSQPIAPAYDTFGPLPSATFGGSSIPNNAVAITTVDAGSSVAPLSFTMGLTAHQRFFNPPLANDGAGTFTAQAGANTGGPGSSSATVGSLWNFGFDIQGVTAGYDFYLLYDFDPGVGTDISAHGLWHLSHPASLLLFGLQDSQNLLFDFLDAGAPPVIIPPVGDFNPFVNGEYTFALIARELLTGDEVGRSAIRVNVVGGTSVPEVGSTLVLTLIGLGGLLGLRRKLSA